jgi:hypothetical protein
MLNRVCAFDQALVYQAPKLHFVRRGWQSLKIRPLAVVKQPKNTTTTKVEEAQQKGSRYALQATLVTEGTVLFLLSGFLLTATGSFRLLLSITGWIGAQNCTVFMGCSLLLAYLLGGKAGAGMIRMGKNHYWTSYAAGIGVVLLSTLLSAGFQLVTLLLSRDLPTGWLTDIVFKPVVWMTALSLIPVLIAGTWYGYQLEQHTGKAQ